MDNLWKTIESSFLLRSLFGGAACIASFQIGHGICPLYFWNSGNTTIIIILSLLIGAPIYALHRAILYLPFEFFLTYCFSQQHIKNLFILEQTIDYLMNVWRSDNHNNTYTKTNTWGDNTHLLYNIGWSILIGILGIKILIGWNQEIHHSCELLLISSLFLTAACISDFRLHSVRNRLIHDTPESKFKKDAIHLRKLY